MSHAVHCPAGEDAFDFSSSISMSTVLANYLAMPAGSRDRNAGSSCGEYLFSSSNGYSGSTYTLGPNQIAKDFQDCSSINSRRGITYNCTRASIYNTFPSCEGCPRVEQFFRNGVKSNYYCTADVPVSTTECAPGVSLNSTPDCSSIIGASLDADSNTCMRADGCAVGTNMSGLSNSCVADDCVSGNYFTTGRGCISIPQVSTVNVEHFASETESPNLTLEEFLANFNQDSYLLDQGAAFEVSTKEDLLRRDSGSFDYAGGGSGSSYSAGSQAGYGGVGDPDTPSPFSGNAGDPGTGEGYNNQLPDVIKMVCPTGYVLSSTAGCIKPLSDFSSTTVSCPQGTTLSGINCVVNNAGCPPGSVIKDGSTTECVQMNGITKTSCSEPSFKCSGDAIQCSTAYELYLIRCGTYVNKSLSGLVGSLPQSTVSEYDFADDIFDDDGLGLGSGTCPDSRSVSLLSTSITFSYQPFCSLAVLIEPFVLLSGVLIGARIVFS